ncbi:hypothetical protein SAMN04487948_11129 [Halogranum amylolyticum]|uniref:Uncharacterized protein n=1 Tax=Halogranum amylolyticum TaxID=660520 RepID=A0A1H8UH60_9EURY|nr:hypothetical protein SAMN04487948_11129 [Halogranum amylolyticum]
MSLCSRGRNFADLDTLIAQISRAADDLIAVFLDRLEDIDVPVVSQVVNWSKTIFAVKEY